VIFVFDFVILTAADSPSGSSAGEKISYFRHNARSWHGRNVRVIDSVWAGSTSPLTASRHPSGPMAGSLIFTFFFSVTPVLTTASQSPCAPASILRTTTSGSDAAPGRDVPWVTNLRHLELLERADKAVERARKAIGESGSDLPEEFVLADLQDARGALEEVTGKRTTEDLLRHIFSRFCIGK
jgi:hypothetical protein